MNEEIDVTTVPVSSKAEPFKSNGQNCGNSTKVIGLIILITIIGGSVYASYSFKKSIVQKTN